MIQPDQDMFCDDEQMLSALRQARLNAARRHIITGLPLRLWANGQAVDKSPDAVVTEIKEKMSGHGAPGMDDMDY